MLFFIALSCSILDFILDIGRKKILSVLKKVLLLHSDLRKRELFERLK